MERFINMLDEKIALDEEANDPDGALHGLHVAWKMAQEMLKSEYKPKPGLQAVVWADGTPEAILSGEFSGRDGITEGLSSVAMTALDLWHSGASGIQIELYRNEGEN